MTLIKSVIGSSSKHKRVEGKLKVTSDPGFLGWSNCVNSSDNRLNRHIDDAGGDISELVAVVVRRPM